MSKCLTVLDTNLSWYCYAEIKPLFSANELFTNKIYPQYDHNK